MKPKKERNQHMKFIREIIQSAKDAWGALLRFLRKRPPDCGRKSRESSQDQNPPNSPSEETETADPPKQPQESQTQVSIETLEQSLQKPPNSSESSGDAKDEIPETQLDSSKEETPPSDSSPSPPPEETESQSESEQNEPPQKPSEPVQAGGKQGKEKPNQVGGRRGSKDGPSQPPEDGNRPGKPELPQCRFVCCEETDGRWAIALAVEEGQNAQSVRQGNNKLSANSGRYILEDIAAEVTVKFKDEQDEHSSQSFQLLEKHKFAVFKMRKNWQGEGQKVKTLFSGNYVVFAHKSCGQRINKEPSSEPGRCRYPDFIVHFFSISENNEKDGFENCSLPFSSAKRFSLKGQRFPDDSDLGELFGDDAPQLIDAEKWREISWIVIGRENGGKVLSRFRPNERKLAEVLGERSGWFFVRIYDDKVDLLHSFDFRRAKGLKNIFVNKQPLGEAPPIVPTKNGHTKTIVHFEGDLSARPADDSDEIEPEKENAFAASPRPENDRTKWILSSGVDCVEAEILLPRIWWKFIEEKGKESDWQDTPIEMKREEFRRAENEKIRIRLPLYIPEIAVGFGDFHSPDNPTFRTKLSKDRKTCEAEFRLDDFAFDQAIAKPLRKAMDLRVKLKDSDVVFPIVRIPADAPPPDNAKPVIGEGFSRLELERAKEELYQEGLIAAAKAAEKFRAKGLKETILFDNIQKCLTIPFDPCRRESMQSKNVEKLKAFFKKHFEEE